VSYSHGSQNLSGTAATLAGVLQTVVQVGVLVALWAVFARRQRSREELVRFACAAVVAFIALGKVLSPQFLIWLIPLVPLVRRWTAAVLFIASLVLTQVWFPQHYFDYVAFDETMSWVVLARDLALVALLGALVLPPRWRLRQIRFGHDRGPTRARALSRSGSATATSAM
jgi:hypothetical protein